MLLTFINVVCVCIGIVMVCLFFFLVAIMANELSVVLVCIVLARLFMMIRVMLVFHVLLLLHKCILKRGQLCIYLLFKNECLIDMVTRQDDINRHSS